jgi:hypothetical protein
MTMAVQPAGGTGGRPSPSGLADEIDPILDKGLVIDAYVNGLAGLVHGMKGGGVERKTKGALEGAMDAAGDVLREFTSGRDRAHTAGRGGRGEGS